MRKAMLFLTVISITAVTLAGCANFSSSGESELLLRTTVTQSVARSIHNADNPDELRAKIMNAADKLRAHLDTDEEVVLVDLGQEVRKQLGYADMIRPDQLLVDDLLALVGNRLKLQVDAGVISEDAQATLEQVITWVELGTLY